MLAGGESSARGSPLIFLPLTSAPPIHKVNPAMRSAILILSAILTALCIHGHQIGQEAESQIAALPEPERFPVRATWYGRAYAGRLTASGTRFNPAAMTAAHRTLPFGTRLRVTWLGRSVEVTVTDRTAPGVDVLDLSSAAFQELAPLRAGVLHVVAEVL